MKTALYIDCCIRGGQSRTRTLADAFFYALPGTYRVTRLDLQSLDLLPLNAERLADRDALIAGGKLEHPRFRLARQLAEADLVVIAAPFWDLSFPALLKLYIENVSVEGITFRTTQDGLAGLCRAERCVFLTTRGGTYPPQEGMEQATPYLTALGRFFGFGSVQCVAAEGLDIVGFDASGALRRACAQAKELAASL